MTLAKWDPFRELAVLQNSIGRLFNESFARAFDKSLAQGWSFPVDIKENPDAVVIKAELPGMNKEDIKVSLNDSVLTITGERKNEEKEENANYLRVERSYGSFSRSFAIDVPVKQDEVKARYQDGVLEITLPKDRQVAKSARIQIE